VGTYSGLFSATAVIIVEISFSSCVVAVVIVAGIVTIAVK
jgi:hypothetical protein